MSRILLRNCVLVDPEGPAEAPGSLLLEGDRIAARLSSESDTQPEDARIVDLAGTRVAPGFLDLHHHGRAIFAANDAIVPRVRHDARNLLRHGVTGFLVTSVTWPGPRLSEFVTRAAEAASADVGDGATPLGLHLEGPWIRAEAAGAQPRGPVRAAEVAEVREILARGEGRIRMLTYAPEVEGAEALQEELSRHCVIGALGHSMTQRYDAERVMECGARHVTHLYNAMGPFHHRAPGLAGLALADERLPCDLICDGAHVDPEVVRFTARALGERLLLISDRVDPEPAADFGAGPLRDDGVALRLADGTLAGSRLTLESAAANLAAFAGVPAAEAVAAATLRPARLLGIESERGTLRPGARADLAVLDDRGGVVETWLGGRRVHPSAD
jgi:N-acetylglucosamine-6-phosphate deacetylase